MDTVRRSLISEIETEKRRKGDDEILRSPFLPFSSDEEGLSKEVYKALVISFGLFHRGIDNAKSRRTKIEFGFDLIAGRKTLGHFSGRILKFLGVEAGEQQNISIFDASRDVTSRFAFVAAIKEV